MMKKYKQLQVYLVSQKQKGITTITLTFTDIEKIIETCLPKSAKKYLPWWANTNPVIYPKPWIKAGFKTTEVDLTLERVCFTCFSGSLRPINNLARPIKNDLNNTANSDNANSKQIQLRGVYNLNALGRKNIIIKNGLLTITVDADQLIFNRVCRISPLVDSTGKSKAYHPQLRYNNLKKLPLHLYGSGSFCRFQIPSNQNMPGIYAIVIDKMIVYLGKCDNLTQRFNYGYGVIHPRNCYINGQVTNCRINKKIAEVFNSGSHVDLYFHQKDHPGPLEKKLIKIYAPKWNIKIE